MSSQNTESVLLLFPHQLFSELPDIKQVHIIEDTLFFKDKQYPLDLHVNKLILHRASMKAFENSIDKRSYDVTYHNYDVEKSISVIIGELSVSHITIFDPVDYILEKRIRSACKKNDIELEILESPLFINTKAENEEFFGEKTMRMASFYKHQRNKLDILVQDGEPAGGSWSYDEENRKKIPAKEIPDIPADPQPSDNKYVIEARKYILKKFPDARGTSEHFFYPVTREEAGIWFQEFLESRFSKFGPYEDAIVKDSSFLYHSVLSPLINIGLIKPLDVVNQAVEYFENNHETVSLATIEGFVRQIIGWREFMRAVYVREGVTLRNSNDWNLERDLPKSLYDGTTGLDPLDDAISGALRYGYSHHIERLMVIGNAMFLLGIHPDQVYAWFMELYVDAYDWVMVGNVYGMSQDSRDGLITTKPYFSGSNYIRKMSNYKSDDWCEVWDALYWSFIIDNTEKLSGNARWAFMVSMAKKMEQKKKDTYLRVRDEFLKKIYS